MDREATARAQRRRQAHDALEFERNRATSLEEQLEAIVAELEGSKVDEEAFARMAPEDVEAVRAVLQPEGEQAPEEEWLGPEEEWAGFEGESAEADPGETEEETEEEIARLQKEIAASRRRQEALERYIEALNG